MPLAINAREIMLENQKMKVYDDTGIASEVEYAEGILSEKICDFRSRIYAKRCFWRAFRVFSAV